MKVVTLASSIITTLLLLTTMICGLWIRANNVTDTGSLNFHVNSGIASVIFCLVTMILIIAFLIRQKKGA